MDTIRQIKAARAAWAWSAQAFVHWTFVFEIPFLCRVNFSQECNDLLWEHCGVQALEGAGRTADCPVCLGWPISCPFPHLLLARSTIVLCNLPHWAHRRSSGGRKRHILSKPNFSQSWKILLLVFSNTSLLVAGLFCCTGHLFWRACAHFIATPWRPPEVALCEARHSEWAQTFLLALTLQLTHFLAPLWF